MNKWQLKDLPQLMTGDCIAYEAEGWEKVVHIIGARSFHWELVEHKVIDDEVSVGDYAVAGAISKGVATHLLSQNQHRGIRIYRPRIPMAIQVRLAPEIIKRIAYYGDQRYDWFGVLAVAFWLLLRKIVLYPEWWVHDSNRFWCLEFDEIIWRDLGYPLVPESEPPHPGNMENSPMLELIWGTY